jgi:hypothetical protein
VAEVPRDTRIKEIAATQHDNMVFVWADAGIPLSCVNIYARINIHKIEEQDLTIKRLSASTLDSATRFIFIGDCYGESY